MKKLLFLLLVLMTTVGLSQTHIAIEDELGEKCKEHFSKYRADANYLLVVDASKITMSFNSNENEADSATIRKLVKMRTDLNDFDKMYNGDPDAVKLFDKSIADCQSTIDLLTTKIKNRKRPKPMYIALLHFDYSLKNRATGEIKKYKDDITVYTLDDQLNVVSPNYY